MRRRRRGDAAIPHQTLKHAIENILHNPHGTRNRIAELAHIVKTQHWIERARITQHWIERACTTTDNIWCRNNRTSCHMLRAIGVSRPVRLLFYPTHQLIVTAHAHTPTTQQTHTTNTPKHILTHPLPQQNLHHVRSHRERKLLRRRESLGTPRGGRGYPVSCEMARVPGVGKYVGT